MFLLQTQTAFGGYRASTAFLTSTSEISLRGLSREKEACRMTFAALCTTVALVSVAAQAMPDKPALPAERTQIAPVLDIIETGGAFSIQATEPSRPSRPQPSVRLGGSTKLDRALFSSREEMRHAIKR
jgi:hypothetical protein